MRRVGFWCSKGHVIDDDGAQCQAVGVVYVDDAECEWTDEGWQVKPRDPLAFPAPLHERVPMSGSRPKKAGVRQIGWYAPDYGMHHHDWIEPVSDGVIDRHAPCRPLYVEEAE